MGSNLYMQSQYMNRMFPQPAPASAGYGSGGGGGGFGTGATYGNQDYGQYL